MEVSRGRTATASGLTAAASLMAPRVSKLEWRRWGRPCVGLLQEGRADRLHEGGLLRADADGVDACHVPPLTRSCGSALRISARCSFGNAMTAGTPSSSSLALTVAPSVSRRPPASTPAATVTARGTTRPDSRT